MFVGVLLGIAAALGQSLSYLFSAAFMSRFQIGAFEQFLLNHLSIGLLSLLCLPLLWDDQVLQPMRYAVPLVAAMATYLIGQTALYKALQYSPASRVSPLLGIKVMVVALIGALWLQQSYALLQWSGVALCMVGAIWLSLSGGRIKRRALGWVCVSCMSYALSDLFIFELIERFETITPMHAASLSVVLCYMLTGVVGLLGWRKIGQTQLIIHSLPAALSWFVAVICLFGCFAFLGAVFGGVVQSSRGLISILLGVIVAAIGWRYAEPLPPTKVFIQRFSAAALMMLAIALFSLGTADSI